MGMAFELVLKALAVSEGRKFQDKHDALTNYCALSPSRQDKVAQATKDHTDMEAEGYLEYLDERMCHPDRKYSMVDNVGRVTSLASSTPILLPHSAFPSPRRFMAR